MVGIILGGNMKSLYQIYNAELEKVALANYYERRENEKAGVIKFYWNDTKNEALEGWLNRTVKAIKILGI